jgi:hypothetical protein
VVVKMKSVPTLCVLLLAGTLLVAAVHAASISLEVSQEVYGPGDTLLIRATLTNPGDAGVDASLDCSITARSEMAIPFYTSRLITIPPGGEEQLTVYQTQVGSTMPADVYYAVCVLSVDGIKEDEKDLDFTIEGTLAKMTVTPRLCRDGGCSQESLTYLRGETVYLRYSSSTDGISVRGSVTSPGGAVQQVTLPTVVEAEQTGTYTLDLVGSKPGYQEVNTRVQFAVLEEEPNIQPGQPRMTASPTPAPPAPIPTEAPGFLGIAALFALLIACLWIRS